MRPLSLVLPASLLVFAAGAAAQTSYPRPGAASISTVQVSAPQRPVQLTYEEADRIGGAYALSNGWRLDVQPAWTHIDAVIDAQKPIRLIAVGPYRFVSRDGSMSMEFNRGARGEDMVMRYMPDPRLARVVEISSVPLAQR